MPKREENADLGSLPPTFRAEVGMRLRELEKRFTNREAAALAAGVAKSTFQRWVEGKSDASFEGLARLAKETGVSLDWLAYGVSQTPSSQAQPALISEVMRAVANTLETEGLQLAPGLFVELVEVLAADLAEAPRELAEPYIRRHLRLISSS